MNERIKELAEQVGAVQNVLAMGRHDGVLFTETELEKFALLIARECRDIVGKTRDQAIEDEWNIDEAMSTAMYDIDEHFGVEE
jgi:hypothetical protein